MVFLSGNSHPELSRLVSDRLGIRQGEVIVYNKTNRETSVDIRQSVRGKHVFILQSGSKNVNNDVMELLILIYACKTSMSKTITVMMPYLPYSKQCRMLRRSSIPMKLIAEMICRAGASRLVSLDLYKKKFKDSSRFQWTIFERLLFCFNISRNIFLITKMRSSLPSLLEL